MRGGMNGAIKLPKSLTLWPSLPRTVVGKVQRREVRADALAGTR